MDRNAAEDTRKEPNKPADVLRDTNLKAAIWRNESEKGPFYATEFTRTYRDADGEYRDTQNFRAGDLLRLAELARKAYERTNQFRQEDRAQSKAANAPESREERRAAFKAERMAQEQQRRDSPRGR